jgi:hypothetical protein
VSSSEAGERKKILKKLYLSQSTQGTQRKTMIFYSGSAEKDKNTKRIMSLTEATECTEKNDGPSSGFAGIKK